MAKLVRKSFDAPDESRQIGDTGHLELINLDDGGVVGRVTFQPGWRWSTHVKPTAGTDSCEMAHTGYCLSGRMHIVMDDGQETDYGAGDFARIPPGHDAWTVGEQPVVMLDWQGMADYGKG
jgi:quercetin dioxygenase-like cupin family protein